MGERCERATTERHGRKNPEAAPVDQWGGKTRRDAIVYVIDDDASLREAVSELLRSVNLETRTYGSAQEFISARRPEFPGCIVLDVRLPGGLSGLEFQERFSDLGINLPVVLISAYGDIQMTVRAMKAGAVDFLPKPFRDQDILDAVSAAIEIDRIRRSVSGELSRIQAGFARLSRREKEVMMLVTAGKPNKQAAGDLGVREATIKFHRSAVMRKMGARTLADLVRMADVLKC